MSFGKFIKNNFPDEKNIIYAIFCIWVVLAIGFFMLSSSYGTKYEWLSKINPWSWWDSFWVINSLISLVTVFLVYKAYSLQRWAFKLQETELKETHKVLKSQEEAMTEQKVQSLIVELLGLSKSHLENFTTYLKELYPTAKDDLIVVFLGYIDKHLLIESIKWWRLNNAINYFRTLKYIESLIVDTYRNDDKKIEFYIWLIESQITDNIRSLYNAIITVKEGIDLDKITFEYLFKRWDYLLQEKWKNKGTMKNYSPPSYN